MTLAAAIPDGATVLVDTNPVIYVLDGHPLAVRFESIFSDIEAGRIQALVTPITIAEVVTGPLRAGKEDADRSTRKQAKTTTKRHLRWRQHAHCMGHRSAPAESHSGPSIRCYAALTGR